MADNNKTSTENIAQSIKEAPGTGVIGALKTFGGFFVPVVRVNEGTRKRSVEANKFTDEAIQEFSASIDQLAQERGVTFQGLAAQDPVASQKSARDTIYTSIV